MGYRLGEKLTFITGTVALDSGADVATFTPGRPIAVERLGYAWNAATVTNPENLDIELDKRITLGSNTGRTAAQMTIAGATGEAQGDGAYTRVGAPVYCDADEELVIQVANAATAGDGYVFIEYRPLSFEDHEFNGVVVGLGDLVDRDL